MFFSNIDIFISFCTLSYKKFVLEPIDGDKLSISCRYKTCFQPLSH